MKTKQHLTNLLEAKETQLSKYKMDELRSIRIYHTKRRIKELRIEINLLRNILK